MGGVRPRRLGGLSLAVGLFALLPVASAATTVPTHPCPTQASGLTRCLRVDVPLDRSGALPGTVRLRTRIQPPASGTVRETIVALAGGPGQAAAPLLEDVASTLGQPALRDRRLVMFDQRGTGGSGRLICPELASLPADAVGPEAVVQTAVAGCANRLGPARTHYATGDSVEDIEAVRSALGVDQIVLYGTSYGTKVALDYAAAYPQHVSKLLLDSVVPPEGVDAFERPTIAAIPSVLRALCSHGACPFTRDAAADFSALAQRLGRGPLRGRYVDDSGHPRRVSTVRRDLYPLLLTGDLLPFQRALVPAAVRAALDGDPALLLRLVKVPAGSLDTQGPDSDALFLATRCEDGLVPWAPGTPIAARSAAVDAALAAIPADQFAPFGRQDLRDFGTADICRAWPEAPIVQAHPPLPEVPTLILSGDEDLRTPRSGAIALAARIPGARLLAVPQTGHSVLGSEPGRCAKSAVTEFLAGREPRPCRRSGESLYVPADVPPRSLRALRPVPGPPLHAGRTLAAVGQTIALLDQTLLVELLPRVAAVDLLHVRAIRFGGLRGGSLVFTRRAVFLRRYSVVPGVTLSLRESQRSDPDTPSIVRVGGRAAAHGTLRLGRRWIAGRLDGHLVRVRTRLLARKATATSAAAVAAAGPALPGKPALPPLPPQLRQLVGWR